MKSSTIQVLFLCLGFCAVNSSYNVAFHKPAWLSSTYNSATKAENVVDGTKYKDRATLFERCVHTNNELFPRWWVNLTGDYTISRIDIDYRHSTTYRMKGYKLIISDTESRNRWGQNHQIEGHICRHETRSNPPAQQMVPCLTRGRFITYADNEGYNSASPFVELCELEAYGCLTGWFGQDNCSEPCPDGCRDRVCNPDNGTCFAGCESGLQGDICDTACNQGTFGFECQQLCFCDGDTCEPQTGTCPSGRCQRGWNGTACNQRCGEQTFGSNCEETCHCQEGSCDPVNGTCLNEGCEPGWQTESCSQECDKGRFGYECHSTCGTCINDDACDHVTGQCPNGCSDGWTTPFCNESCPIGTFGFNCTGKCFCKNGTCDPTNGFCSDNACDKGWYGPTCSSQCEPGTFGYNCEQTCHCQTASCNRTTGHCPPGGCMDGWRTDTCSQMCDQGSYGTNCSETCGSCMNNDTCHHINGHCTQGCTAGFRGDLCDKVCNHGSYGTNCSGTCGSCMNNDTCHHISGHCTQGCTAGFKGDLCDKVCNHGSYGNNCSGTCGSCMNNDTCHHINGHCTQGCTAGFKGDLCDKECEDYHYGVDCQQSCHGCKEGKCQKVHGACLKGCISEMTGYLCNIKSDDQNMSATIGGVLGGFLVIVVIGILAVSIMRYRIKRSSVERSVNFHKTDTSNVDIVSPHVQNFKDDKDSTNTNGNLIISNEKPIYEFVNEDKGPNGENVYKNMDDGYSVGSIASHLSTYHEEIDDNVSKDMDESENVYSNYVATVDTEIRVSELTEVIAFKKESGAFNEEYAKLPKGLKHSHECGKGPANKDKNRFRDMVPYDHSRVVLAKLPGVENSEYINANYIDSVTTEQQYIATQGPKEETVWDFWRMVWEQNSGKIVMVTNLKEGKKIKCHTYWPPVGKTMTNGHLSVSTTGEKRLLAFIIRTLSLINQETDEKRSLFQFHFITWPDHGVPNPFQLVQFQRSVDGQQTSLLGPLVVHCSAGIGRTGTYIGLDALLKHSQSSKTIDVYQYTLKMRKDRLNMIQTVEQYIALHDALDVSLTFPDTSIPKGEFGANQDVRHFRIQEEFEALSKSKPTYVEEDYSIALSNITKNRSRNCLPVNRFRVRLKSPMEGRDDYINAVILPSCSRSCGFLTTQLPLVDTCVDFWCMVYDHNSQIVVLLDKPESDVQFLPEDRHTDLEIEIFNISMSGTIQDHGDTQEVDICLHKQQNKEKRQVKVLLTTVRDRDSNQIVTRRLVDVLSSTNRLEAARKNTPITVVCRDGKTNCVPFCLLKAVVERMDLDNTIDVFNAAREIQNRRPDTFTTMEDIRVIYKSLDEYIDSTSIYLNE